MCGGSGLQPFLPIFTPPGLTGHALSIAGVRESHCNDSLKEGKKKDTETRQAMGLPFALWTSPDDGHSVELIGSRDDLSRVGIGIRVQPRDVDD